MNVWVLVGRVEKYFLFLSNNLDEVIPFGRVGPQNERGDVFLCISYK